MKKLLIAILSIMIIIISPLMGTTPVLATTTEAPKKAEWPSGPSVTAESAIIMEASTGLVLYSKNINEEHYPASITKIMTVLLALEKSSLGDIVTFSKNAVYDIEAGSSRIYVDVGEQMTMQQCLYAILLDSANDVSYGVAEHIAGSVDKFADMMNEKAKSLGCKNTHFVNPHGLPDENHYTSAYDMALITREAMKNDTFRKIFGTRTYTLPPTNLQPDTRPWHNHHKLVLGNEYKYEDCIGGKTGYTVAAKHTLVTVAKRGDLEVICVIMSEASKANQYNHTKELFDFAFDNYSIYPIADIENSTDLSESPMFTRYNSLLSKAESPITTDKNGFLILPNNASFEEAKKEISFFNSDESNDSETNSIPSSKAGGKVIGKISYTYDGKYVGGANILYNKKEVPVLYTADRNTKNPTSAPDTLDPSPEKSGGSLKPIIIGVIIGLIILAAGLYYVLIERPRLKRRHAYYKKKALRKLYRDDDFIDL